GHPSSGYHIKVTQFKGTDVIVEPSTLLLSSANQKLAYKIKMKTKVAQNTPEYGEPCPGSLMAATNLSSSPSITVLVRGLGANSWALAPS
uniref:Subtilisin-like protease fibronectin type-III domain-containing protein n=1 Tax=Aegilops tauschii subsp. strangulata TaxID=200361 RepID=A0A453DTQ7_AEGTS